MTRMSRSTLNSLLLFGLPALFIATFFVVPLVNSVAVSLGVPEFTLAAYRRLVDVPVYRAVYGRTLRVALIVTLVCVVVGYPCAYYISTLGRRGRIVAIGLIALPFMLSVLVRNYVWMVLLQDTGLVNRLLIGAGWIETPVRLMHNELGVLIAMANMLLPYVIFPVLGALLAIPPELRTASASLGANGARTFWRVTLPLTSAGTAAGALLTFIVGLGFYITPAMMGGAREMMVANLIAFNVRDVLNWTLAFSLSTSLLASTIVLYFAYRALLPRVATLQAI
ncbi:MAG: ABC transporter permease [Alphaproteobacteria bacterium]|nr:ABC transporter permease [Alphaproteobacteria bacterium]